jgi:hypothetical protein
MSGSESQRLRIVDQDRLDGETQRPPPAAAGAPSLAVATATQTTYPTAAGAFYYCTPIDVFGPETEGAAGVTSAAAGGGGLFAFNLGPAVPPPGTPVLVTFVRHRWVFRYG